MFAVVNHLHFNKPVAEFTAIVRNEGMPLLASFPGFVDFNFIKEAEDKAIVIIIWKDAESAMNGAKQFGPTWFAKNFAPYFAEKENRSTGEVLVSYKL